MEIDPLLVQFGASLVAIFALAGLAKWLKLGGKPTLSDASDVRCIAAEVVDGFDAQEVAISGDGLAALSMDAAGEIMAIKRHGNRFAGRILTGAASSRADAGSLIVDCGEARFGKVRLTLENPVIWVERIKRLS